MAEETSYSYDPPEYQPPKIVVSVGSLLRAPRNFYKTDFADLFSPDREVQHSYVDGLLAVGTFFLVVFLVWSLLLIILKVKGREVGCASGQAFHSENSDDDLCLESTDSSESYNNSTGTDSESHGIDALRQHIHRQVSGEGSGSFEQHYEEENDYDSQDGWLSTGGAPSRKKANPRERRTRFCFMFFSFIALVSVPCILVFSFGPMKEATRSSDDILMAAHDALDQVAASLNAIQDASDGAEKIVEDAPTDMDMLCPKIDRDNIESELGVDLNDLVAIVSDQYNEVNGSVTYQLRLVKNVVEKIDTGLTTFESSIKKIEAFMWIIPGLLFAVSLLVAGATFGVLLAWKDKSGARIQRIMSYFVLPMLITISTGCWILVICASFGSMISSDMCTAGSAPGSPDETIQQIILSHGLSHNNTAFKLVNAYTNRCKGSDPTEDVNELQEMVQHTIDTIWRQISKVDSLGRAQLIEQCGGEGLEDLFAVARNLAKILTSIRRSLDSATGSLECNRIQPIYAEAAHNTVCTDAASASAFGFILFLILAISTMTMISLRASWLRNIEEEKVYLNENEVAENMIVDEHEEYLNYISRYKHEWQEYRGFDAASAVQSREDSYDEEDSGGSPYFDNRRDSRTDGEGYNGSEECSEENSDITPAGINAEIFPSSLHAPSVDDGARACAIDEISFRSLSAHNSMESASIGENEFFFMPSPLLPPSENPDYRDDAPDVILIPSTEVILKEKTLKTKHPPSIPPKSGSKKLDEGLSKFFDKYGIDPYAHEKEIALSFQDQEAPGHLDDRYDAPTEAADVTRKSSRLEGAATRARTLSSGGVDKKVRRPSSGGEMTRPRSSGDELIRRHSLGADLARSRSYAPSPADLARKQSQCDRTPSTGEIVGCHI